MLQVIRSHAGSWVIKVLLGGIIASFTIFGIADIIRGYGSNKPIAHVGKIAISVEEFAHSYKRAVNNLQERFKGHITPEQIKEIKLADKVLESMAEKHAIEQDIKHMNIVISDSTVTSEIRSIPSFLNKDGTFDFEKFHGALQAQGMSEKQFIQEIRGDLAQFQLLSGLTSGFDLSDSYLQTLFMALEKPFHFVALDIPLEKMKVKDPTTADLHAFFEKHKESFRFPEMRTVTLLKFNRKALLKKMELNEADLQNGKFNEAFEKLQNEVEDALAAGSSLKEISEKFGLTLESTPHINRQGQDKEGKSPIEAGIAGEVTEFAFANNQGSDSPVFLSKPTQKDDKSDLVAVIAHVEAIAPSHIPEFKNIEGKAKEACLYEMKVNAAQDIAKAAQKEVKTTDQLKKFASTKGLNVIALPALSRSTVDQNALVKKEFSNEAAQGMFGLTKGETLPTQTQNGFKVVMLSHMDKISLNQERFAKFKQAMVNLYHRDLKDAYSMYLKQAYPLTVEQDQINHIVGEG